MAVLKCKMCGGSLEVTEDMTVCECEYCGTMQTIPQVDDEKKINLFTRANRLRAACEFDKAAGVYENIVSDFPEEAEAYWGLILCKFGIEYVDDPKTGRKIPTCHRSSFESIMDDSDFEQCMENADPVARKIYREEAKVIDGIQKGILEISGKEEPYDIFICYKETDDSGNRTVDSVIAQDIYDMLTANKYRVFFARISLEDKLGTAYEPYIFAALNSARIMLAVGTDYEYYNAVWVKNEWSRFLAMMSRDKKKVLIPCYKDIDAYDMPKEFKHLQAQDMGKVGAMQDLLRGIGKIIPKKSNNTATVPETKDQGNTKGIIKLISFSLSENNLEKADKYCDQLIMINSEQPLVYFFKCYIGIKQGFDVSRYAQKLNTLAPEISEHEINLINNSNYECLFWAFIENDCISRAKYISEKYPDVLSKDYSGEMRDGSIFSSILNYAVVKKKTNSVKNLLLIGCDPKVLYRVYKNKYGQTRYSPLSEAIWRVKNADMVKLLLEHGADPNLVENIIDDDGNNAAKSMLTYAVIDAKSIEIISLLLKYGADPNKSYRIYSNKYGQTRYSPLGDAIWNIKNVDMVKLLLEHRSDPNLVENIIDDDGNKAAKSMLTYAVIDAKSVEMVDLLIHYGATWSNVITYNKITKKEKHYPYQKIISNDFARFLKTRGWKGSIF